MTSGDISRRSLFVSTAVVIGAAAVTTTLTGSPAQAAPAVGPTGTDPAGGGTTSANGWPVLAQAKWHAVEGSGLQVQLADGAAAVLLTYVARRFHYEIDGLRPGDLSGFASTVQAGPEYESNYRSGTALAIRPQSYPLGVRGGLYPNELLVVGDILAELGGTVVWGGDFEQPKESHFEIAYPPGHPALAAVVRRIGSSDGQPGTADAGGVDAFEPTRRAKAKAFARKAGVTDRRSR